MAKVLYLNSLFNVGYNLLLGAESYTFSRNKECNVLHGNFCYHRAGNTCVDGISESLQNKQE